MIERYEIAIPEARLARIRDRVAGYDWDRLVDAGGWQAGMCKADLRRLAAYWLERFDWRAVERRLNAWPHFVADVEGEPIHFIHVRGDGSKPPLLLLHGWPGSFIEFEQVIAPLVADGHDVVVPSLPGFAFSNPINGIVGPRRAGVLMHALMAQLFGDARYIIQGGDWGAHIASWMAFLQPDAVAGFHVNMAVIFAEDATPDTPHERDLAARRRDILDRETAYSHMQETRPQTLGAALSDSPVGLAAWIVEKFAVWSDLPRRADGGPDLWARYSEEQLLTNIMLYAGPASEVTATWIYHGKRREASDRFPPGTRVRVPMAIAAFPDPVFIPPTRDFAARTYTVARYTEMPRGGHFAALEQPELLLGDLRAFIATLA